ncbi:MAG: type II/IV secretion system protein, partial [Proteobacteria bacterium]|nr:type II/IV secretion system protein [Pseudomonadota bacterium]
MKTTAPAHPPKEHRLSLVETVDALVADGLVAGPAAEQFKQERRYFRGDTHPLIAIAEQKWKSLAHPGGSGGILDLDALTQWLARWSGLEYFHIDPLKVNFSAVTELMSSAYATRFRVLPVEVRAHEVVIATAEPFERAWEEELQPILRKKISRVISNPLDIAR